MDFNRSNEASNDNLLDSNINIKDIIFKYLRYWKWFLLSLVISIVFTFYKLNFMTPLYKATATIKLKDEKGGDNSTLSVFQDLGITNGTNDKIEDEIEILKSKSLISEVIKSLKLNIRFFTKKNNLSEFLDNNLGFATEYYETENYKNPPLKVNFFDSDSAMYSISIRFTIFINSTNSFTISDLEKTYQKKFDFGEKLNVGFGDIIITPNTDLKENKLIGENVLVQITSIRSLARGLSGKVQIEAMSDFSNILSLSIADGVRKRSEDFLNELVKKYNERAINLKEKLSKSTSDFVTQRLEIISEELSNVDLTAESLKTRYRLSDAASSTGLNMQSGQEIEKQIVQTSTQLEIIESVKNFVETKETNDFIPVNVGVEDNTVSASIQQYNEIMLEKKRLLKTSTEKNPIVANLNEQLKILKDNISLGLKNLETSQKISIDALNRQDAIYNSRLYSAPKQERQIRDVQRQQGIKESLYLYLLQKREETAITLGVVDPNAKIIDRAESGGSAIYPNKKVFFMVTIFIGLLIPFLIIYLIDFLNTKVRSREEVEKLLNIPVLGDIPKFTSKKRFLIGKEDYSSVAEAFRILRTNINFLLTKSIDDKGKVIFITSTIAHEGKSFVASNLAASLGFAGKKTLIMGMDVRAPSIKSYLGIRGTKGITNYIIDKNLSLKDITLKVPKVENLDIISSGDIPPNPAELLMSPRVKDLFDSVKGNYDFIIVDTAASSIITDTTLISHLADAFIYVIRTNHLDKRLLGYVQSVYKDKIFDNLGLVINGIDHKKGYGYGYGYGYKANQEKVKKKWWQLSNN